MRNKLIFNTKDAESILLGKKKATIRIGKRIYSKRVKIYVSNKFFGRAEIMNQFYFKIKNIQPWMLRKLGISRKRLMKEFSIKYGRLNDKIFTFIEFKLEVYVAGIDLGLKYSGVCILGGNKKIYLGKVKNEEILSLIRKWKPVVISIDAPLRNVDGPWGKAELELIKRGFKPLPLNLDSMKKLRRLAMDIKSKIKGKVIETFADADKKILGIKGKSDVIDATACALTSYLFLLDKTENIFGVVIPKERCRRI